MAKKAPKTGSFKVPYNTAFVRGFIVKSVIFLGLLFGINLFIMLYFRHTPFFIRYLKIPDQFYFPILTGLSKGKIINAVIFTAVIFLVYIRKQIEKLKPTKFSKSQVYFGVAALVILILQYAFKYWIRTNLDLASSVSFFVALLKYLFNIAFVALLALSAYGPDFVKQILAKFKKEIAIFSAVFFLYWALIEIFQKTWVYLSTAVTKAVGFLLSLTFSDVIVRTATARGPQVGVGSFAPYVSAECSGIDSLQLFISIWVFLIALDWKRINRKRMFLLFIPGILATFLYNIVRVYLIMLVGIYISPTFAIDTFHTNIGWILFLVVFYLFWNFGSRYVYEK